MPQEINDSTPEPSKKSILSKFCFVALGSNMPSGVGSAREAVESAIQLMNDSNTAVTSQSRLFTTPAFPKGSGPEFVNAVVGCETSHSPTSILGALHEIEESLGRIRRKRWGPRVIDLDLLAFGDQVLPDLETYIAWENLSLEDQQNKAPDSLVLPHPRLHERSFVLVPLQDVAPTWTHPVTGKTVSEMVADLAVEDVESVCSLK